MAHRDGVTVRRSPIPTVLLVGGSPHFADRFRAACEGTGVVLLPVDPRDAATLAARHRPLVLFVLDHVFKIFVASELEVLAHDVGARLVTIEGEQIPAEALAALVLQHVTDVAWLRQE